MNKRAPNSQPSANPGSERDESYLIPDEAIHEFAGNLRLSDVHCAGTRLVLITEIAVGLVTGELDPDHLNTIRATARELSGEQTSPFVDALLSAIERGEEELPALIRTVNRARYLVINYTGSVASNSRTVDIDRMRFAIFKQRQKRRSELKASRQRPARKAKAQDPPPSAVRYEQAYACSSDKRGGERERRSTQSVR